MNLIFGGTFDPVHRGHTHLAREILKRYQPEHLLVIPTYQNPHKAEQAGASASHRLEMVKIAMGGLDARVRVLDIEACAPKPSYTLETVHALKKSGYGSLCLLMGDDVFNTFFDWYKAETLVREVDLVVVTRSETKIVPPEQILSQLGIRDFERDESSGRTYHGKRSRWIDIFHFSPLPLASTDLRAEIGKHRDVTGVASAPQGIEPKVWNYIKEKGLYTR